MASSILPFTCTSCVFFQLFIPVSTRHLPVIQFYTPPFTLFRPNLSSFHFSRSHPFLVSTFAFISVLNPVFAFCLRVTCRQIHLTRPFSPSIRLVALKARLPLPFSPLLRPLLNSGIFFHFPFQYRFFFVRDAQTTIDL